jgi:hypothetical protein
MKSRITGPLLALSMFFLLLEVVLRSAPHLLPLAVLEQYEPDLRGRIARSLRLPTRENTRLLPRRDGGPADRLWVYRPEADVTWALDEPGIRKVVRMDGLGFCNPVAAPGTSGPADIVVIGDSFAFCTAVDSSATWPARLGEDLDRSVYNLGLPARGPYEYLELLRTFGLAKRPRVVIMTIYEGNDLRDAVVFATSRDGAGQFDALPCDAEGVFCESVTAFRSAPLVRDSYALGFVPALFLRVSLLARRSEIDFRYAVTLADGTTLSLNSRNGDRDEVAFARALVDGSIDLSVFEEAMTDFAGLSREHGFTPVIVYVPAAYTAYGAAATFEEPAIQRTMRDFSGRLRGWFAGAARRKGMVYLDTTERLAAAATASSSSSPVYFPVNVHLTPAGHDVVADAVEELFETSVALQTRTPGENPGRHDFGQVSVAGNAIHHVPGR